MAGLALVMKPPSPRRDEDEVDKQKSHSLLSPLLPRVHISVLSGGRLVESSDDILLKIIC